MMTNLPVFSTQMTWQYIATSQQMDIFCLLPSASCLLHMFHQSAQPLAMGNCHRLKAKQAVLCSVQPGRQSSAAKRRSSSSSGDVGWPKAAWYLKGMGR